MENKTNGHSNNEYIIMNEIAENQNISQRELSRKLGLSLGTVNLLINKMIKEGVLKMEQVSQKQVMYMLTPAGMIEKAKKTVSYLKSHYRVIYETKDKIITVLNQFSQEYENMIILKSDDEIGHIVQIALSEYQAKNKDVNFKIFNEPFDLETVKHLMNEDDTVLLYAIENEKLSGMKDVKMVNLIERL
jgi:DNA-binding MarR family transcriptional regulator